MKRPNKNYRLICILDAQYLHIHIVSSDNFQPIEIFAKKISDKPSDNILYQWGQLEDLKNHNRSVKVLASEINKFGQIGIGSLWRGNEKNGGMGGGEGFLFDDYNFRIIKGNKILEVADSEGYWTFQVANFNGAKIFTDLSGCRVNGRLSLQELLLKKSENKPFIATFDVEFIGEFFARSNGIFIEDEQSSKSLFTEEIVGGHLLGGSNNLGDIKSLKEKFSEAEIGSIDFSFVIKSQVLLQPIQNYHKF